jgi:hypothetical protein
LATRYNDDDQPIESLVRDSHGELLGRIDHNYTDGRLVGETLVWVSLELASELRELPAQELRVAEAQMKQAMTEMGLNNIERSYVYDDKGRVIKRLFRAGDFHDDTTTTYNEHGDEAGTVRIESCFNHLPDDPKRARLDKCRSEVHYRYEYDSHGNWTEQTVDGSSSVTHRKLTYY